MARAHGRAELPGLDGYWSRLSDEELLTISFTTSDPESLPVWCTRYRQRSLCPSWSGLTTSVEATTQDCVASIVTAQSTLPGLSSKAPTNADSLSGTIAAKRSTAPSSRR